MGSLLSPSSGAVRRPSEVTLVGGLDRKLETREAVLALGPCPQH